MGMSRGEMYARLGLIEEVDPLVTEAYNFWELIELVESDRGHDRKDPWHISFHGSQFPGDNSVACGRQNLYRMMDLPRGVFSRKSRQLMDQGKDVEVQIVKRLWRAGLLLSNPPHMHQTEYEDAEHWMTSTVDAIALKPRSVSPYVIEVKQIYDDHIEQMKHLVRDAHEQYVRQLKCQIGVAYEAGPQRRKRCINTGRLAISLPRVGLVCPQHAHMECLEEFEINPPEYGYLYYLSRDNPIATREYYYEYDPAFMEAGRRQLARWRDAFINDELPQTRFDDKRFSHPFGWKWTKEEFPCRFCDFGDICREDHRKAVNRGGKIRLSESVGVEYAREYRPEYDFEAIRASVLARWGFESADT